MSDRGLAISFRGVSRSFGAVRALQPTDLEIGAGEFLTLLGPSGSGKTTLLNIAAGYLSPSAGRVHIGTRDVTDQPPRRRNIGMVFQNYALFPHLDVFENVAFGLRERRVPAAETSRRVAATLDVVRLAGYERRRPGQLSGGEQQRVALARALVVEPLLLLMDEPLGALDRKLREEMQLELKDMLRRLHVTSVFVTHDQDEALAMADRVAVMYRGRIEQVDTPAAIYENPATVFCAGFLGLSNIFQGAVTRSGPTACLSMPSDLRLECPPPDFPATSGSVMIRPEKVLVDAAGDGGPNTFPGEIAGVRYLGAAVEYHICLPTGDRVIARQQQTSGAGAYCLGNSVRLQLPVAALRWLKE